MSNDEHHNCSAPSHSNSYANPSPTQCTGDWRVSGDFICSAFVGHAPTTIRRGQTAGELCCSACAASHWHTPIQHNTLYTAVYIQPPSDIYGGRL